VQTLASPGFKLASWTKLTFLIITEKVGMAEKEMHFLDFWTQDPEFFREKVPSLNIMIGSTRPDHE